MNNQRLLLVLVILLSLFTSCTNRALRTFKSDSARSQYQNMLESAGIHTTKIGAAWKNGAEEAISNPAELEIPMAIQGSFKSKSIEAKAWRIQLEQGSTINIAVYWQASDSSKLIVDLMAGPERKELQSYIAQNDSVNLEAHETGTYLLRIQPELFGEGNFQVRVQGAATYSVFPVQGKTSRAIQSIWGDIRDGGRRAHEGVDIFASRGTPVLSPVEGIVTSVRDSGLGGKQVWVRDPRRKWNLYFAHLDSQMVRNLQRVNPGDTLGLVGNTGNAKTTAPHLHFGIYQSGAINPFPVIQNDFKAAPMLPLQEFSPLMKVKVSQANLRSEPSTRGLIVRTLAAQTPVFLIATTSEWHQVQTADGTNGYLSKSLLAKADSLPLNQAAAFAYTNPLRQDSLLVKLDEFVKRGSVDGMDLIQDGDDNIFYLPSGHHIAMPRK
jgi:murein DD-endopeptidase MepM/ murein hydrolase activator NlpD